MTDWVGQAYERYAASLYRYAAIVLADPVEAGDVVHQVFAALLRHGRCDVDALAHYLRRAVRNECYTRLRRRVRLPPCDGRLLELVAPPDDPAVRVAIERALGALPPEQREVVHLKVFEGCTFQEIADLVGESINTVASRYRYALDKLRELL